MAHVDHGKTTLVDRLLQQTGTFRSNERVQERALDTNDLERERGITILAKNTSILYRDVKINIVDTPGHADFGGEVERILGMVDGVLLLVDAAEGPLPQTRFVLKKSLDIGLRPIVVINKVDRSDARPHEVLDEIFQLMLNLGASDSQLDFPILYASAKLGFARHELEHTNDNVFPLLDTILDAIPSPPGDVTAPLQFQAANLDYNDYVGRMAIGRIQRGTIRVGEPVVLIRMTGDIETHRVTRLETFVGLRRVDVEEAAAGEVVSVAGIPDIHIGETLADPACPEALPPILIDEPTLSMEFIVNDSPLAGREGRFVTSRHLRDRLHREARSNVALRIEETGSTDALLVSGRGELHLAILVETMRREGYELQLSRPQVILKKDGDGATLEPIEDLSLDLEETYTGRVMEMLGARRAELSNMTGAGTGRVRLDFAIPARGLLGFRRDFLTETRGTGIMSHVFHGYGPHRGEIPERTRGALIVKEAGDTVAYALYNLENRGSLFVAPGVQVYAGMIIGEHSRDNDLVVNPCKKKHLTNMRAAGADDAIRLTPPRDMDLEDCIEFIASDELVEVTPGRIRLRKRLLDSHARKRKERGRIEVGAQ
ncbi:MAG: translational GTPase TypA [Acidobacteria bacterium]|nr:translational GTPase TypA [Acidobacteriota bacterium]